MVEKRKKGIWQKYAIWILILVFSFVYSSYAVLRYLRIETGIFDLGYYDQLVWLAAHGKPLYSSILESRPWVDHLFLDVYLLAPLYWLKADPRTLLIFQSVFICLGAYPIYLMAQKKVSNRLFSLSISFCYLAFYGIQNAIAFDFHPLALAPTLIAFIFWFYEERRFTLFWLFLLLLVGLQENFFILAAAFGLYLMIRYKDYKRGLPLILGGLAFFVALIFWIVPHLLRVDYYYLPKSIAGFSLINLIKSLFIPIAKLKVVWFSFLAFGFLPIISPVYLIFLAEEFFGRLVLSISPNWWTIGYQYDIVLVPFLALAAIESVEKYFKRREVWAIFILVVGTLASQVRINPNTIRLFNRQFYNLAPFITKKEAIAKIPPDADVAATNDLGSWLSEREHLIFFTDCATKEDIWAPGARRCFKIKPQYIIANLDPEGSTNNYYRDYSREMLLEYVDSLVKSGEFYLLSEKDDIYLLKAAKRN